MIDTLRFSFYLTDKVEKRLREPSDCKLYGNKFFLDNPFSLRRPRIFFNIKKRRISTELSPAKLLQGHNVFGTNDLNFLCFEVIGSIYRQVGVEFTTSERREIEKSRIRLHRVDLACSFLLESREMVIDALHAIQARFLAENWSWSIYGSDDIESVYRSQGSERISEKFYYKGPELRKGKVPINVIERRRILEYADHLLRFEVTFRAKSLVDLDKQYCDQWTVGAVKDLICNRLKGLKLPGALKQIEARISDDDLGDAERVFILAWRNDVPLWRYKRYRTLSRARDKILMKHQVDIFHPRRPARLLPLNQQLCAEKAIFTAPKSLTRRGAIVGTNE